MELFLLLLDSIVKSELNFKHSNYFIYHYGNSINYGYFADGRPIGDGSRHIKDTPIKYEDRMCKYSLIQFIRQFRNKGVTQIHR